ncbi:abortive phage resistance protein [Solemya velum gill symbiont]|uniref:Abortive phage resistance protein n=2 Tax=Solemya velum gill symbiont TaxID=2340 RepID=A0A1T2D694_SOVGS|nr:abortive infection family protein [Solemya velum gill symbiont]OOY33821.1 abortive phage resistance protein [Solemya velum gill symbiont]OOY42583.1 abortive phage resistance protein [Solemya velum gill symbiont]OOY45422.1 abortive phage resistance protein [Solemya velum gill symbiont]OOY49133.1 abortive phage resistance protein [Solemya velum gill symbiont]
MVALKRSEMRVIDEIFEMGSGYVLNFSDRTMAEFFEDEFGIEIYQEKFDFKGTSKAKHLRAFIEVEDGYTVGQVLRKLWNYRNSYTERDHIERDEKRLFEIISRIDAGQAPPVLSKLSNKADILSLDTVLRDLKRALDSAQQDPESAVTSSCSTVESVCRSILIELGLELPTKKDIKGLFNAVKRPLGLSSGRTDFDPMIADDVRKILGGLATIVEGIGALRTHGGDAHGRERGFSRMDMRIANLAIHSASTVSLFLIETWKNKYPTKELHKH